MDLQIEITVAEHGRDPDNGDKLLSGFEAAGDRTEVVVEQNMASGVLTATFFVAADSVENAVREGIAAFAAAAAAAGLRPSRVIAVSASACTPDEAPELIVA